MHVNTLGDGNSFVIVNKCSRRSVEMLYCLFKISTAKVVTTNRL